MELSLPTEARVSATPLRRRSLAAAPVPSRMPPSATPYFLAEK